MTALQAQSWSAARLLPWRTTAPRRCAGSDVARRAPTLAWLSVAGQVVLEAETTNQGALRLYARAGFVRDKRLGKYYLSGADAYRLKLLLPSEGDGAPEHE